MRFRGAWLAVLCLWTLVFAQTPQIGEVVLRGRLLFSEKKTFRVLGLREGEAFAPEAVQAASDRLLRASRLEAYAFARVRWRGTPSADGERVDLELTVEPGERGKLGRVVIEDNQALSREILMSVLTVRPRDGFWDRVSGNDLLWVEDLAADQQRLLEAYHAEGFFDAEIGAPSLEKREGEEGFEVKWTVHAEGPRYRVGAIRFQGDSRPLADLTAFPLRRGSPARVGDLRAAADFLRETLLEKGFGFGTVEVETKWREGAGEVDLSFMIRPGNIPVLREIRLEGNTRTRSKLLMREIPLRVEDPFHAGAIRFTESALARLDVFETVEVEFVGHPELEEYDLVVRVREKPTGRMEAGVTWGSVEGPAVLGRVLDRNLSLRPPFRGGLLIGDVSATVGAEILRIETGLQAPRLGESAWGLGGRLFYEDNQFVSEVYDQRSSGASLIASHPVGRWQSVGLGVGFTQFELYDIDQALAGNVLDDEQNVDLQALLFSWEFRHLDRQFRPGRGLRLRQDLRWGIPVLGGETDIIESITRWSAYVTPYREHVLTFRGGITHIAPTGDTDQVPIPLRAFLGGPQDLRAFEYRSLSGRNEEGIPIGDEAAWWAGIEYLIPALPRLDLALYSSVGDTAADAGSFDGRGLVAEWGVGALIRAENFPVRFDLAFPLQVREGDPDHERGQARFSFSAGYVF